MEYLDKTRWIGVGCTNKWFVMVNSANIIVWGRV